jgi:hypothetical protein
VNRIIARQQRWWYRKRLGEEGIIKKEGPRDDVEGASPTRKREGPPF